MFSFLLTLFKPAAACLVATISPVGALLISSQPDGMSPIMLYLFI